MSTIFLIRSDVVDGVISKVQENFEIEHLEEKGTEGNFSVIRLNGIDKNSRDYANLDMYSYLIIKKLSRSTYILKNRSGWIGYVCKDLKKSIRYRYGFVV